LPESISTTCGKPPSGFCWASTQFSDAIAALYQSCRSTPLFLFHPLPGLQDIADHPRVDVHLVTVMAPIPAAELRNRLLEIPACMEYPARLLPLDGKVDLFKRPGRATPCRP
jgi:hypothetical protein